MMLFPAQRPLESRLRDVCAGTQCALSSPCFLPTVHNLLRPGDFYCIRCPLNFDAGNLCRKQPVGSSPALEDWVCRSRIGGTRRRHAFPLQIVLLHASMCGGEAEARSSAERHHHYLCLLTTKRGPQKRLFRCGLSSDYLWEFNTKN